MNDLAAIDILVDPDEKSPARKCSTFSTLDRVGGYVPTRVGPDQDLAHVELRA